MGAGRGAAGPGRAGAALRGSAPAPTLPLTCALQAPWVSAVARPPVPARRGNRRR